MAAKTTQRESAFIVREFVNARTGSISFRVMGSQAGRRVRENFPTKEGAEARRFELEGQRLGQATAYVPRGTTLTPEQLKVAEAIFGRGMGPEEVRQGMQWWEKSGKAAAEARAAASTLTVESAATLFRSYVTDAIDLRPRTKQNLKSRIFRFSEDLGAMPLVDVTPETVEAWLAGRNVANASKVNDRLAVSRFFSWCKERPQRFVLTNPASEVRVQTEERGEPDIYTGWEVRRMLSAGRRFRGGRWLKFLVLQLFGGLRPTEAIRFEDSQLVDGHIRVNGTKTKTGRGRVTEVSPVLAAWLKICPAGPVSDPQSSKLIWNEWKRAAGLRRWIPDGLRHTALSHYFRRTGSYGLTAEWAGNSEAVIREHYAARTTAAESEAYWTLFPDRKVRRAARAALAAEKKALGKGRRRAV